LASKPVATVSSGLASKPAVTVFASLTSKLVATVFPSLASKPMVGFLVEPQNQGGEGFLDLGLKNQQLRVWWLGPQNHHVGFLVEPQNQGGGVFPGLGLKTGSYEFGDLGLKITATVSWFGPQNYVGFGLSVAP
jgi:hypothetical protein